MAMTNQKAQKARSVLQVLGSLALLLFPLILMIAFGLHFETVGEFFVFELRYEPSTASDFMATLTDATARGRYTMAHMVGYLDLPLFIGAALFLGSILFDERPWVATIGAALTVIGTVYMGGVFGSWLSFAALGNLTPDQVAGAIPALEALTEMQGPMLLTTMLSGLSLLGLMVLAGGLLFTDLVPKWSPALIFLGNLTIFVFMDLDNWMMIGALMMLIGSLPISLSYLTAGKRLSASPARQGA
jgi:hypothetical protein